MLGSLFAVIDARYLKRGCLHLQVDMTKVNMDVMRPWIAMRVTQLLGFEDEVLINFIYELLEGKVL